MDEICAWALSDSENKTPYQSRERRASQGSVQPGHDYGDAPGTHLFLPQNPRSHPTIDPATPVCLGCETAGRNIECKVSASPAIKRFHFASPCKAGTLEQLPNTAFP